MKKKSTFKKYMVQAVLGIFLLFARSAFAQLPPCDNPCPPGAQQFSIIPLCSFSWNGTVTCMGPPVSTYTYSLNNMPFIQVIINFRIKDCAGVKSVLIDDYVYMDNSDYWINDCFNGCATNPSISSALASSGCGYPTPATSNSIKTAVAAAINQLLTNLGISTQASLEVYFPGSCYSLVHLSFPAGSFWTQANDLGGTDTIRLSPGSDVTQSIPCDPSCCKVTYKQKVITLANGMTQYTWIAMSYQAGAGPPCETNPIPDYNLFPNKLTATVIDPLTGMPTTVYGVVTSQDPCTLTCPSICMPPGLRAGISTDINKEAVQLELLVAPTLVNNFVKITSNKALSKVQVFDVNGKQVLLLNKVETGEVNTSELKPGTYFMRITFNENEQQTVKILKQ
ncbi:MAG: T9SS type A sorting domain-containing protein [Bacteroidia bacterium]|nr:T9SS type A sorting domain-containing protein [Bacteroidia bacterium]